MSYNPSKDAVSSLIKALRPDQRVRVGRHVVYVEDSDILEPPGRVEHIYEANTSGWERAVVVWEEQGTDKRLDTEVYVGNLVVIDREVL